MIRPTPVTEAFDLSTPIIQAPMGGGPTTAALVAAVCEAGGLGSIAGGYLTPSQLQAELAATGRMTARPFAVNLFAPQAGSATAEQIAAVRLVLDPVRAELGLAPLEEVSVVLPSLEEQVEVVIEARPALVSFTFGLLPDTIADRLRSAGSVLMGTATSVAEAAALVDAGADWVCAQGAEAGAHRGTFLGDESEATVGTIALVPQICDAVDVPVVAAGGVMDGRGLAAVLALGASAAQLGTAFLRCPEAGTPAPWRRALRGAADTSTSLSAALTGRTARGIRNRLMRLLDGVAPLPPYPVLHAMTAELRRAAAAADEPELMSLWCGQGVALGADLPAGRLVERITAEAVAVGERMAHV